LINAAILPTFVVKIELMSTFLFDEIIFGPVRSRRLGASLGINLLPSNAKWCSFNCIYCECGWTEKRAFEKSGYPLRTEIKLALANRLELMKKQNSDLDVITFAGNGEPTLHPEFPGIIDDTIELRNKFFPRVDIAVLSNSTMIHLKEVREALMKVDQNILKLDSAIEKTFSLLNQPVEGFNFEKMLEHLMIFKGRFILQTMFVKGSFQGQLFDNTTEQELKSWVEIVKRLSPSKVMIYTIARDTPASDVQKISLSKLNEIAAMIERAGIPVQVSA
jgi:wyosine [tRNA(Phe)-imidazoG37] synthetase (radical SAM superfamily)